MAFLLGDNNLDKKENSQVLKTSMSTRPLSSSSSGISKRIQNKMKSDALARKSHSANNFKSEDIAPPTRNCSFDMSRSAAMVANALELSGRHSNCAQPFKSSSVSSLRKKSPPQISITPKKANSGTDETVRYVSFKFKQF